MLRERPAPHSLPETVSYGSFQQRRPDGEEQPRRCAGIKLADLKLILGGLALERVISPIRPLALVRTNSSIVPFLTHEKLLGPEKPKCSTCYPLNLA